MAMMVMKLESLLGSVREARHFVRRSLAQQAVEEEVADTVELLTSEVVTNAVLHAASTCELNVAVTRDRVRVEIHDQSSAVPVRLDAGPDDQAGRGLLIVDRLARDWGFDLRDEAGKLVWFEVARP